MKFVFGALVFVVAAVLALAGGAAVAAGPGSQTTTVVNITPTQSLCFPYVQTKNGVTTLHLVNASGVPITYTVTAYDAAGHLAGALPESSLAAHGSVQVAADALAGLGAGWYRAAVSSSGPLVGVAYVQVAGRGAAESYAGVACAPAGRLLLAPYYLTLPSGLAGVSVRLANGEATTATVRVSFRDGSANGQTLPEITIPPQGWVDLGSEQIKPGGANAPVVTSVVVSPTVGSVHGLLRLVRPNGSAVYVAEATGAGAAGSSLAGQAGLASIQAGTAGALGGPVSVPYVVNRSEYAGASWSSRLVVVNLDDGPRVGQLSYYSPDGILGSTPQTWQFSVLGEVKLFDLAADTSLPVGRYSALLGGSGGMAVASYTLPDKDVPAGVYGFGASPVGGAATITLPLPVGGEVTPTLLVQNAGAQPIDVIVEGYAADGTWAVTKQLFGIPPGTARDVELALGLAGRAQRARPASVVVRTSTPQGLVAAWVDVQTPVTLFNPELPGTLPARVYLPALARGE